MRVLVCGDRKWWDRDLMFKELDRLHAEKAFSCVIEGEAQGADLMAARWAVEREIEVERFPAEWSIYGKAAGPIRNQTMLRVGRPELVVAFHYDIAASKGTANMLKISKKAGIPTLLFPAV